MTELERARELGRAAFQTLEANRRRIDDLNVYPVPDGDTGTNLTETARAIMDVLEVSTAADRAVLAKELTRAALMGARGNSGVIFSQILRGAAEALGEAGLLDAATIRRAFRAASDDPTCLPRSQRRRLPRRAASRRGDDAVGDS